MKRLTKRQVIDEFIQVIKDYDSIDEELFRLVDEGKINSGCLLVRLSHNTMPYRWLYGDHLRKGWPCRLYGTARDKTRLSLYQIYLNDMKKELERARDFISRPQHGWKGHTE
ncbi:hypothetical protein [Paenibacillus motobuensis]|uniref:Uncharacterized protein n=1 Tax=Paenibacillus motobuensis TaxID=295324 RepID=A0ABN0XUR7_9BACL